MSSLRCCLSNFRKWTYNPRMWVVGILSVIFALDSSKEIAYFSAAVNVPVTPWVFPFIFTNNYLTLCIMLTFILCFCDAPFLDKQQPNAIIRIGRMRWAIGQMLYIVAGSFLFFSFIFLVSLVILSGNLTFSLEWGKVLGTLAQTDASVQYSTMGISYRVMLLYEPLEAMFWCLLMTWLVGTFLGMLMFALNLWFPREVGAIVAGGFVVLGFFIYIEDAFSLVYFSPVSWCSLLKFGISGSGFPSRAYVVSVLILLILALGAFVLISIRKKDIDVMPSV